MRTLRERIDSLDIRHPRHKLVPYSVGIVVGLTVFVLLVVYWR